MSWDKGVREQCQQARNAMSGYTVTSTAQTVCITYFTTHCCGMIIHQNHITGMVNIHLVQMLLISLVDS